MPEPKGFSLRTMIKGKRAPLILMFTALFVRLLHAWFMSDSPLFLSPTSDAGEHFTLASTLAGGDWLGASVGPYHRPQLFAYVLAFLFKIFGTSFLLVHLFLILVDSIGILAWYILARRCFPRTPAFIGCLFIAIHWTLVHFSTSGYMETFAIAVNGVMLSALSIHSTRLTEQSRRRQTRSPWTPLIVAGIFGGLGALTRPTILFVMPGLGFALLWLHWRAYGRSLKACAGPALFVALVTITFSPSAIRDWTMFGTWAPLGAGSELNFHMGNAVDGWGWDVSSPGIEFRIYQNFPVVEGGGAPSADKQETLEAHRQFWTSRNSAYIHEHFGQFIGGYFRKLAQLYNSYEIHCTQAFQYSQQKSPVLRILPGLTLFMPLGVAGLLMLVFLIQWSIRERIIPDDLSFPQYWNRIMLLLWIIPYLLGVALYLSIARHRLPVIPPLLLFAGWSIWTGYRSYTMKHWKLFTMWAALLIMGLGVSSLSVIDREYLGKHERWWTQVNLGAALVALNRPDEAITELQKAADIYPEKMETWRQLSLAESVVGDYNAAVDAQKQLLMRQRMQYPDYYMIEAEIFDRLASLQFKAGKVDDAEQTARKLAKLVPDSPTALLPLALILESNGKKEEALGVYRQIAEVDPGFANASEKIREMESP